MTNNSPTLKIPSKLAAAAPSEQVMASVPKPQAQAGVSDPLTAPANYSPRRLRSATSEIKLRWHDTNGKWCEEEMSVCLAVDDRGAICELNFVMRPGEQGATLDQMFSDLGIQLSRVIQGRDPETGAPI